MEAMLPFLPRFEYKFLIRQEAGMTDYPFVTIAGPEITNGTLMPNRQCLLYLPLCHY